MIATNRLTAWLGAYALLVVIVLTALSLDWRLPKLKPAVTPWFGVICFVLGWMVFLVGTPIRQIMREPISDYFRMFSLFTVIACWIVGLFCGNATCRTLRGKIAILLNLAAVAFSVFSIYAAMTVTY